MNIIRHIINRDCHVGMPYRKVVRHVISRLKNDWDTFKALSRDDRRYLIVMCYATHYENRKLYDAVMTGRISELES